MNFSIQRNGTKKLIIINSLMISVVLTSNFIATLFASMGVIEEKLIPILLVSSLLITFGAAIILKNNFVVINNFNVFFISFIIITFLVTFLFNGLDTTGTLYFIDFFGFGVIIFLLTFLPFSSSLIIIYTMGIGNLVLLNPFGMNEYISIISSQDKISMGATYALLPSVVATIIFFFFIKKFKKSKLTVISLLSNSYLLYQILAQGSRGATMAIVLLFCFVVYIKLSQKLNTRKKYIFPVFFTFFLILVILFIVNIQKNLLWVLKFFEGMGIKTSGLMRTSSLISNEGLVGILNNRDSVYKDSLDLFLQSPIWGHGIGSYADEPGVSHDYSHNLFLQLLVEGGLLLTIPFLLILGYCIWSLIKPWFSENIKNEDRYLILFLFISIIPRLMVSSYLWTNQSFWLLLFVVLIAYTKKNKKVILFNKNSSFNVNGVD